MKLVSILADDGNHVWVNPEFVSQVMPQPYLGLSDPNEALIVMSNGHNICCANSVNSVVSQLRKSEVKV